MTSASLNWMFLPRIRWFCVGFWPAAGALVLGGTGCANPGPAKAPSLHLPRPAEKVVAERVGDRVVLGWAVSTETTDGGKLRLPITAVVCRDLAGFSPKAVDEPACTAVQRLTVVPGPVQVADVLPGSLSSGPPALLVYRVQLLNPQQRGAAASAPAYAVAGATPKAAGAIGVTNRRNGALITWKAEPGPGAMEVQRTLVASAAGPVKAAKKKNEVAEPAGSKTVREAVLAAEGTGERVDRGGMVDRGIHDGDTVTYRAQRVRMVELEAPATMVPNREGVLKEVKAAWLTLAMRGEASAAVTFVFRDTAPPGAPTGLAAVPGGGFGQAASIDLSWEPGTEADVVGYNVYRAKAGDRTHATRLNAELVAGPAYRDATAEAGMRYVYWVTAVDQRHNESERSLSLTTESGH